MYEVSPSGGGADSAFSVERGKEGVEYGQSDAHLASEPEKGLSLAESEEKLRERTMQGWVMTTLKV